MSNFDSLIKRLDALDAAMSGTLTAKFTKLTDEQREQYRRWRTACDRWHAQFTDPGDAYAAFINDGDEGPPLRRDVREVLYGPALIISTNGVDDAAEQYRRLVAGD